MATTHIYNKLQDTSIYINLSSQNVHSAIAALKQEAKPLTTLNIKGIGDTKRGSKRQGDQETRQRRRRSTMTIMMMMMMMPIMSSEETGISGRRRDSDRLLSGLFLNF